MLICCGDQTVFWGAYDWVSRRWAVPNILAIRFGTASITKLVTSVAAMQLVDEGHSDLQQGSSHMPSADAST
ncbi:MAG: hypothetical protein ACRDRQ_25390 [Pseudonocardiaceae bacterium]